MFYLTLLAGTLDFQLAAAQIAALTNESIIGMVRDGQDERAIIAAIESSKTEFTLDSDNLTRLHDQKIPAHVIRSMLRKGSGRSVASNHVASSVLSSKNVACCAEVIR